MRFHDVKGNEIDPPEEFGWRPAVYGVLIEDNRLLIMKPSWDDRYMLPGGGIHLGETPAEALVREFLEETGYRVKAASRPMFVDSMLFGHKGTGDYFQRINIYFEVALLSDIQEEALDPETAEVMWVKLNKLRQSDFTHFQREFLASVLKR
jgi:8-oxo-dGTP diphosphatase